MSVVAVLVQLNKYDTLHVEDGPWQEQRQQQTYVLAVDTLWHNGISPVNIHPQEHVTVTDNLGLWLVWYET
jgi:hypothetical protein